MLRTHGTATNRDSRQPIASVQQCRTQPLAYVSQNFRSHTLSRPRPLLTTPRRWHCKRQLHPCGRPSSPDLLRAGLAPDRDWGCGGADVNPLLDAVAVVEPKPPTRRPAFLSESKSFVRSRRLGRNRRAIATVEPKQTTRRPALLSESSSEHRSRTIRSNPTFAKNRSKPTSAYPAKPH